MSVNVYLLSMLFVRNGARVVIKTAFIHSFSVYGALGRIGSGSKTYFGNLRNSLFHGRQVDINQ